MNVLLLGSGGREHALALAIARSPALTRLLAAPGNPGIAAVADCLDLDPKDHRAVLDACRAYGIHLVVVGPEAPLVGGLVDALEAAGVRAFGPSRAAARLEGSKGFTKDFCTRHGIRTAPYGRFDDLAAAREHLARAGAPIVVKADGLAAGKGVTVAATLAEAEEALAAIFATTGASVVIEAVLVGEEVSFFALCDGRRALPFAAAQDHKRVGEGDTGPNTGGMGAYSPTALLDGNGEARIMREIVEPTLRGMAAEGAPFKGVLFAGLMLCSDGQPRLIEYNVRFGDPETQAILPRLESDLLPILAACAAGELPDEAIRLSSECAVTVVVAASGYPSAPRTGGTIRGLERMGGAIVTQAGTALREGELRAAGGRVLNVTALGDTIADARKTAYAALAQLDWPDGFYRRDIALRATLPDAEKR